MFSDGVVPWIPEEVYDYFVSRLDELSDHPVFAEIQDEEYGHWELMRADINWHVYNSPPAMTVEDKLILVIGAMGAISNRIPLENEEDWWYLFTKLGHSVVDFALYFGAGNHPDHWVNLFFKLYLHQ